MRRALVDRHGPCGTLRLRKQSLHLSLPVAAVAAKGAYGGQLACLTPTGDRLGADAEHLGNLGRSEHGLVIERAVLHGVSS